MLPLEESDYAAFLAALEDFVQGTGPLAAAAAA